MSRQPLEVTIVDVGRRERTRNDFERAGSGMGDRDSTCWTLLRDAAAGGERPRAEFVSRYAPVVRAYLQARWRNSPLRRDLDDAIQDVFVECLREGGLLERTRADRPGGFRAFLFGTVRNVALRTEARRARQFTREPADALDPESVPDREESLSQIFDRAWARSVVREAAERQSSLAERRGESALRRVELLRLRFHEGMPIREIAQLWGVDAAYLHHEYARAREEFRSALREVVASHHPGSPGDVDRECEQLLSLFD
jgi:RNA polymerase sigma-70 factor (ECF subfamily)